MTEDLLEGDESGGARSSDTRPSVLHRLVRDLELSKIVSDHLGFDLHLGEDLAVVNAHDGAGHLGDHDHVSQVSLDDIGLLVRRTLLLLLELLDEGHGLALQSPGELAPDPAGEELHESLIVHVQELVEVDSTEGKLPEGPLLPQLGGGGFVTHVYYNLSLVEVNQAILAWS